MLYPLLADMVVFWHVGFILFAALGGLLILRSRWWVWIHAPAFLWAGFIELTGGICPLTPLENRLRALGGGETYGGDFIDRYLIPLLYPESLTREIQIVLGLFVILLNIGLYAWLWRRPQQKRKTG
ncbi:MAG: DUF2784 domain-containing protein [Deltaproteobacteria bacterium]|nr:DUF2784 domain-containing protein [Deltaproteobacteria bacterium]